MLEQKGQLFYDTIETGLSKKLIDQMVNEEKIAPLYSKAINHFLNLTPLITTCGPKDLQWMKMEYTVPYFMDLCFRCRNKLYGIIFCQYGEDGFKFFNSLDLSISKCLENNIVPTLLPFTEDGDILNLSADKWCLLNAERIAENETIEKVSPDEDSDDSFVRMGKWEMNNAAIMAYVGELSNKLGIEQCLYQDYPSVDPSICWIDKSGVFNWMIIRTAVDGDKEDYSFPEEVVEKLKKTGGKGHLCKALLSNPRTNGVLPRGEAVDIKMEIDDISL